VSLRRIWRVARWGLVGVLVPVVVVIQLAIVLLLTWRFDEQDLVATHEPLVILDVRGDEIATLPASGLDRTRWIPLGRVPGIAVSAVVESEDERFWDHGGVDGFALARALWLDLKGGRYGGSTLTMQVARMVLGNESRTVSNKAAEMMLALRMERRVDKRVILEQWFNRAYFGNGQVGFDAAARFYYGKPATALSEAEALTLAVIPRAPSGYDPLKHLEATLRRRDYVLAMLVERGVVSAGDARTIRATQLAIARHGAENRAPHFVAYAVEQLPADVRTAGGRVHTTLDLQLQRTLQRRVSEQVAQLSHLHLQQAGVVVLGHRVDRRPRDGGLAGLGLAERAAQPHDAPPQPGLRAQAVRLRHRDRGRRFTVDDRVGHSRCHRHLFRPEWDRARGRCATARRSRARTTSRRSTCSTRSACRA
jgi:membrane peptidoglycan carboxypeptidase